MFSISKKEHIKQMLLDHPLKRDDIISFLAERNVERGMTLEEAVLCAKNYHEMDSDARIWRKVQQEYKETRGKLWEKRQKKSKETALESVL